MIINIAAINDFYSGGGKAFYDQCCAIRKDYQLKIILNGYGSLYERLDAGCFDVIVVSEKSFFDLNYVLKVVRFLLRADTTRLVLTHTERTSVKLNFILKLCGFKVATVVHRNAYKNKVFKGYRRFLAAVLEVFSWMFAHSICPVSSELGEELKSLVPWITKKIVPLPNYININNDSVVVSQSALYRRELRAAHWDISKAFTICTFIRQDYAKGVDFFDSFSFRKLLALLARIFQESSIKTFRVCFYGLEGDNKTIKFKNGYSVELVYVRKYNIGIEFLSSVDLYIQPSRHEAFGIAVTEAVVAGVPNITSDIPVFSSMLAGVSFNSSCINWRSSSGWSISWKNLASFLSSLALVDSSQLNREIAAFVEQNSDRKLLENLRSIIAD